MSSKEQKIGKKKAVAGTKRDITLIITETLEIIRKPGNATSQCHYCSIQDVTVDHLWYKETRGKNYP